MSDMPMAAVGMGKPGGRLKPIVFAGAVCALLAGCGGDSSDPVKPNAFQAEIRRTTGGIPHVKGDDYASVGFGMGYVWAEDHGCAMSGRWLTVGAEVAKRFGADGPKFAFDARNGNLASDLYVQKMIDEGWLDKLLKNASPTGVLPEVRELVRGYVAGYNQYLKEVNNVFSDSRCAGADWVRPITERDVYLNATFWADMLTAVRNELSGFMAAVPKEIEEAAALDGAGPIATLFRIVLPTVRTGLLTAFIITAVSLWNEVMIALIFIQSNDNFTLGLSLMSLLSAIQYSRADYGVLFAGVSIMLLPMLVLFILLRRFVIEGMTLGVGK